MYSSSLLLSGVFTVEKDGRCRTRLTRAGTGKSRTDGIAALVASISMCLRLPVRNGRGRRTGREDRRAWLGQWMPAIYLPHTRYFHQRIASPRITPHGLPLPPRLYHYARHATWARIRKTAQTALHAASRHALHHRGAARLPYASPRALTRYLARRAWASAYAAFIFFGVYLLSLPHQRGTGGVAYGRWWHGVGHATSRAGPAHDMARRVEGRQLVSSAWASFYVTGGLEEGGERDNAHIDTALCAAHAFLCFSYM